jgi:hypothetical protein
MICTYSVQLGCSPSPTVSECSSLSTGMPASVVVCRVAGVDVIPVVLLTLSGTSPGDLAGGGPAPGRRL